MELPPLGTVLPQLLALLGGGAAVGGTGLAVAKALLRDSFHVELHRGRLYLQYGVPSSGPLIPRTSVIVRLTPDRGNGAFAAAPIPAGSHICDYEGELLDRAQYFARYGDGVSDFAATLDDEYVLDSVGIVADTEKFSAVHINHSRAGHNVVRYYDRGKRRIAFFTERDIAPGEELLFDYGRNYWVGRESCELP
ncbi:hypothetical protein FOA52_015332 [Chlamydomonas sp. UWO 241]|nr:hypothetical protein FOA52_015332 [Chlamydomonas sp. UWO 241]